jgi:hypothetical protein
MCRAGWLGTGRARYSLVLCHSGREAHEKSIAFDIAPCMRVLLITNDDTASIATPLVPIARNGDNFRHNGWILFVHRILSSLVHRILGEGYCMLGRLNQAAHLFLATIDPF